MRAEHDETAGSGESQLYASAKKVFPQTVSGRFRNIKTGLLVICLGIYYFLPFIRWDRGPNAPDQAVLIDMNGRRAYFFFIEIWPQEVYYLTGLLIIAAMALFLMNAVAGRVWCGYLCPQTVWTDLFVQVEALVEGDRRDRMILDAGPWNSEKIIKRGTKHFLWLMIAWWTGGAWIFYFSDAPSLAWQLFTGTAPLAAYLWMGILTFTTYALAGHMREQVCLYMCPWPRIQAALTDEFALNVTYKVDRGEPRMSLKQANRTREAGEAAGDCVDCQACVNSCPTGVDIREGAQLGCIQCGLCIDACDTVMGKIGREGGLIGYDTDMNIQRRKQGKPPVYRLVRARTLIYVGVIAIAGSLMLYQLATRSDAGLDAIHDRNPLAVRLSDGGVRNGYTLRLINKQSNERQFVLNVEGSREPLQVNLVGDEDLKNGLPLIKVGPDKTREVRVLLTAQHPEAMDGSTHIQFRIVDTAAGTQAIARDFFKLPFDH